MTLIDIIQQIPPFITDMIKNGGAMNSMIGKFHLGLQYDMNIWHQNQACGVYQCKEEKETAATQNAAKRKGYINVFMIVTDSVLLYLEPDNKIKNVARLTAWFTLPSLEQIKRSVDQQDNLIFIYRRKQEEGISAPQPLEFKILMANSTECINMIIKNLKSHGLNVSKGYEKKRKILESEVSSESATKGINIEDLHAIILSEEAKLNTNPTRIVVDSLMELYNKAIVYYSALSNEKHLEYVQKLQELFKNDRVQKIMAEQESKPQIQEESKSSSEQQPNKQQTSNGSSLFVQQKQQEVKSADSSDQQEVGLLEEDS